MVIPGTPLKSSPRPSLAFPASRMVASLPNRGLPGHPGRPRWRFFRLGPEGSPDPISGLIRRLRRWPRMAIGLEGSPWAEGI
jgi:hypothetical protein